MKSWWDLTTEEQDQRMAIEPLTPGAVAETFRHPASYAELRLVKTVWQQVDRTKVARDEGAAIAFGLMGMATEIAAWPCVNGEHWWQGEVCAECGKRYQAAQTGGVE